MMNHEGTGIRYENTDENNVATYALYLLGHRVMYATVNQNGDDFEMWFRAPGKFHWVKSGMICARSVVDPTRASGVSVAEFVLKNMPFLLAAVNDPGFTKIWVEAVKTVNEQFVDAGISDFELFLAEQAKGDKS
jgi:hypothetical protein